MPLDVLCRACGQAFIETNDEDGWIKIENAEIPNPRVRRFNPEIPSHGAMFHLKEPWASWNWDVFPQDEFIAGDALECPGCNGALSDGNGFVLTRMQTPPEATQPQEPRRKKAA